MIHGLSLSLALFFLNIRELSQNLYSKDCEAARDGSCSCLLCLGQAVPREMTPQAFTFLPWHFRPFVRQNYLHVPKAGKVHCWGLQLCLPVTEEIHCPLHIHPENISRHPKLYQGGITAPQKYLTALSMEATVLLSSQQKSNSGAVMELSITLNMCLPKKDPRSRDFPVERSLILQESWKENCEALTSFTSCRLLDHTLFQPFSFPKTQPAHQYLLLFRHAPIDLLHRVQWISTSQTSLLPIGTIDNFSSPTTSQSRWDGQPLFL